jgi:hypothetical protein
MRFECGELLFVIGNWRQLSNDNQREAMFLRGKMRNLSHCQALMQETSSHAIVLIKVIKSNCL